MGLNVGLVPRSIKAFYPDGRISLVKPSRKCDRSVNTERPHCASQIGSHFEFLDVLW